MTNTSITSLSAKQLRRAADLKERIENLQHELSQLLGSFGSNEPTTPAKSKKKRTMSAAGRARISAAAKARWAKVRAAAKK